MHESAKIPLVTTIRERCRVCYTCVRECPAKAIRIADGQADVISERCIGCGNCVRVCGQHAKAVYDSKPGVRELLAADTKVAALVAPSFPAEFADWNYRLLSGVIRRLGFDYVIEVAAGADLVADRYQRFMHSGPAGSHIATTCPAVVAYVERYFPALVDALAPIVSPMVAAARMVHRLYGPDIRTVFIGPCIAKKGEAISNAIPEEIDGVLTFTELREMAWELDLSRHTVKEAHFDPPIAGPGALFAISRGLLQAAGLPEDLILGDVVAAEGRKGFVAAIQEFYTGHCRPRLLEVLACEGCIMGPGIGNTDPMFRRRERVSKYVRARLDSLDWEAWRQQMEAFADLDISRTFVRDDQRMPDPSEAELQAILRRMGKHSVTDELNCGACGYESCRDHAIAIHKKLAESEMCLPYTIDKLRRTVEDLGISNEQLARTRAALMQSEKLASMGQLAAGIAHELNNPLGVVLMYAHMLLEEYADKDAAIQEDLSMISQQADRCKKIVAGLLHFARQNKVDIQSSDIAELSRQALRLCTLPKAIQLEECYESPPVVAELDPDQLIQVLTNLIQNACHAMPEGGRLRLRTGKAGEEAFFEVEDTGTGIPPDRVKKIFEPFYTTKPSEKELVWDLPSVMASSKCTAAR